MSIINKILFEYNCTRNSIEYRYQRTKNAIKEICKSKEQKLQDEIDRKRSIKLQAEYERKCCAPDGDWDHLENEDIYDRDD